MSKYQEVEVKYPLHNREVVLQQINNLNMVCTRTNEYQNDTYYTPIHRDFLSQQIVSEWLRIRETNTKCTLNFKQWLPIGAEIQNHCNEYETVVQDIYALKTILKLLDFKEIIVVNKTRSSWIYENVEISIDYVDGLGSFIELEAMDEVIKDSKIEDVHKHFINILSVLKAETGKRDRRGYPYLLLAKKNPGDM